MSKRDDAKRLFIHYANLFAGRDLGPLDDTEVGGFVDLVVDAAKEEIMQSVRPALRAIAQELATVTWDDNRKVYEIGDDFRSLCDTLGECLPCDE